MSNSLLELSFSNFFDSFSISQIVIFFCLLIIFLFFTSYSIVATICHMIFLIWSHQLVISLYWLFTYKTQVTKKKSQQHKSFNDYYLLLLHCTEIYLHFVMIHYLKRSHPPFNDTYLHALSYKTFYNTFFSTLFIYLFFIERRWFS